MAARKSIDELELDTAVGKETRTIASGNLRAVVVGAALLDTYPLPASGAVTIGRYSGNMLSIEDETISRFHAVLHIGAKLMIEDVGSANGTTVDGVSVAPGTKVPGTKVPIEPSSVVKLGAVTLHIQKRG
jgi:hypothetical protein